MEKGKIPKTALMFIGPLVVTCIGKGELVKVYEIDLTMYKRNDFS